MENNRQKGVLIIGLGLVALFGGILLWSQYLDRKISADRMQSSMQQQAPVNIQGKASVVPTPVLEWAVYTDGQYGFEFRYPKGYTIESSDNIAQRDLSIENGSESSIAVSITRWKGLSIEEGTPGTFWMKLGYGGWKYFVDNFDSIETGKCGENVAIEADPTASEESVVCLITKTPGYIKIELDNGVVFHTEEVEIRWELGMGGDRAMMEEMVASFRFLR